jgi:hypothetical protein
MAEKAEAAAISPNPSSIPSRVALALDLGSASVADMMCSAAELRTRLVKRTKPRIMTQLTQIHQGPRLRCGEDEVKDPMYDQ